MVTRLLAAFGLCFLVTSAGLGQVPQLGNDPLPKQAIMRFGSSRLTHSTWLTCVRFSADDRFIGAADSEGHVRFWDVATGKLLWEQPKGTGRELAFSSDGKTMAIGGYYNKTITLWDLGKGEVTRELSQNARSLVFSPDGRMLAAAGRDKIVRLWDSRSGKLVKEFRGHKGRLYALAISPDGRRLASGGGSGGSSRNNEIRLWDIQEGTEIAVLTDDNQELKKLPDATYSLNFSSDGKRLGSCGPYATRIWDVTQGTVAHRLRKCSHDVAFSPLTNRFATCGAFGIYDQTSGKLITKMKGDVGVYGCVTYSHSGKWIASGNKQGYVQLWNAMTGKEMVLRSGHDEGIRAVAFSPDGAVAASLSRKDATVRLWGIASGKQLRMIPVRWRGSDVWWNEEGSDLWFGLRGREVMTWTSDLNVRYWSLGGGKRNLKLVGKSKNGRPARGSAVALTISPDGNRAAASLYDGGSRASVRVYELDGGNQIASLNPFPGRRSSDAWVSSMAFSPDGNTLAIGALNGSLRDEPALSVQLWDVKAKKHIRSIRSSTSPPGKICFSPDGTMLATSPTRASPLQLWRADNGSEVHQFKLTADAHGRDPVGLAFSADSKLLAAADANQEIHIWEVATKGKIRTFRGHQKPVTSLTFSPDGKTLLSGSEDTTMLLWNIRGLPSDPARLTRKQLSGYWDALADSDAEIAAGAKKALYHAPEKAVELFRMRLKAGTVRHTKDIPDIITALASKDPVTHLQAASRLKSFGRQASPALFKSLSASPNLTTRKRIEEVLESIGQYPIPPDELRRNRAIQLLEQVGSDEAIKVLRMLAQTKPATPASRDASAALKRLSKRFRKRN